MGNKLKFFGSIDDLKQKLQEVTGQWKDLPNGGHQFKTTVGCYVNFYSNGTINFQGNDENMKSYLKGQIFDGHENLTSDLQQEIKNKKIFIVHGHDHIALEQLELILRRVDLSPYILMNQGETSSTIIEALEKSIINKSTVGIVLMTPDDIGKAQNQEGDPNPRARQNVILELGILIGAVGRDNIILLKKGNIEMPSDINGVLYLEFNNHVREKGNNLLKALQDRGIYIDSNKIPQALA